MSGKVPRHYPRTAGPETAPAGSIWKCWQEDVQGMAWAEHHHSSSTRAVLGSEVLRLAYQVLNGALKALSLMEHPVVLCN